MTEDAVFELLSLECRVDEYGIVRYYNALGKLHRAHGPAIVWADGSGDWYQNGQRHRTEGPAVENVGGYRAWYLNGLRHRLDGPAVEWAGGSREWWLNGNDLTQAEWQQVVASMETTND